MQEYTFLRKLRYQLHIGYPECEVPKTCKWAYIAEKWKSEPVAYKACYVIGKIMEVMILKLMGLQSVGNV